MARAVLAVGLAAKNPRESALAVDVLTRVGTQRVDAVALGQTMTSLWVPVQKEVLYYNAHRRHAGARRAGVCHCLVYVCSNVRPPAVELAIIGGRCERRPFQWSPWQL
jgi:hypothetical protein